MSVICGLTLRKRFVSSDQGLSFSKMFQVLFHREGSSVNPLIDAYAAGLIDGEGCIGIFKSNAKSHHPTYSARVDVGMTTKAATVLQSLRREYGGTISRSREATERWAEAQCWSVSGSAAAKMLSRIAPYLRMKGEQAEVALRVEQIASALVPAGKVRRAWTDEARQRCETLKMRMHELNAKGPSTPSLVTESLFASLVAGQWVTQQRDLFSDMGWEKFSGPWPRSGMTRSGNAFERPTSVRHTSGNGASFLLATPTAWLGRSASNSVGDQNRWTNPERSNELSDQVAYLMSSGEATRPPSNDGNKSSDVQHPHQPSLDATDKDSHLF